MQSEHLRPAAITVRYSPSPYFPLQRVQYSLFYPRRLQLLSMVSPILFARLYLSMPMRLRSDIGHNQVLTSKEHTDAVFDAVSTCGCQATFPSRTTDRLTAVTWQHSTYGPQFAGGVHNGQRYQHDSTNFRANLHGRSAHWYGGHIEPVVSLQKELPTRLCLPQFKYQCWSYWSRA
ncbi:hypothetical protein BKA93DRAFT_470106 [Sparassis latifolia]